MHGNSMYRCFNYRLYTFIHPSAKILFHIVRLGCSLTSSHNSCHATSRPPSMFSMTDQRKEPTRCRLSPKSKVWRTSNEMAKGFRPGVRNSLCPPNFSQNCRGVRRLVFQAAVLLKSFQGMSVLIGIISGFTNPFKLQGFSNPFYVQHGYWSHSQKGHGFATLKRGNPYSV